MNLDEWAVKHNVTAGAMSDLLKILSPGEMSGADTTGGIESGVMHRIRLAVNRFEGALLLRNNSGAAFDSRGVPVRFGLGNDSAKMNAKFKSSDLIGLTPRRVGLSDLGRVFGVFTAVEAKREGWRYTGTPRELAQLFFINTIKARGGIAGFASSEQDYIKLIEEF